MMMKHAKLEIAPLVRTPNPIKYESLKGYILRLSEANGYTTPTIMLSTAGMNQGEMHAAIPPLEKLALICNRSVTELEKLGYNKPNGSKSAKQIRIYHHQLPTYYLSIKSPKICTECIVESGYIHSFWDLKDAIACPKHAKFLLKVCPECSKPLTWFRPGLLTCTCGCDLSQHSGNNLRNSAVLGLLSFIQNQLKKQPHDYALLKTKLGFPVEHLKTLTLFELLSIIRRFENRLLSTNVTPIISEEEYVLSKASLALENWPEGLYQYLDSFSSERTSIEGFGLRKQFESFCGSLFKTGIPNSKVSFIKKAFLNYGNERWKQGYVPSHEGVDEKIVGIYGLSKALGIMPSTTRKLVSQGLIKGKTSKLHGHTRHFFDVRQKMPFITAKGKSYSLRNAAKWLGLPVSVLKILRERKHFEALHLANPIAAYHEQDLIAFREKLLKLCPPKKGRPNADHIKLTQVMRMKVGSANVKADFIFAMLNHELKVVGRTGLTLSDVFFGRAEVKTFMERQSMQHSGLCTIVIAAKHIHCDPLVIKSLFQDGLLSWILKPNGVYIKEESLMEFGHKYISCAELALKHHTTSVKIVSDCEDVGINIKWFPRFGRASPQPFIERKDAKLLMV